MITGDRKRYRVALVDQKGMEVELGHRNWDRETKKSALGVHAWLAGLNMEPYVAGVGLYDRENPLPIAYHAYHRTHYHVVTFVNGCLNDVDDGPYESQRDAFGAWGELLESWIDAGSHVVVTDNSASSGHRAVVDGIYVVKVEACEAHTCYEQ